MTNKDAELKIVTKVSESIIPEWNRFIQSHPYGSVLQSWFAWQLFSQTKNFRPVFIGCVDETGRFAGLLLGVIIREASFLKSLFSSRLVVYGGPLADEKNPQARQIFKLLLDTLITRTNHRAIFTQFRASYDLSPYSDLFLQNKFTWVPRINLLIDTTDRESIILGLSSTRRRQIRRSLQNGARIIEPANLGQIRQFYEILHELYRHKVRKPLPDWSFFESFFHLIQNQPLGKYFLIECDQKIIGGIMSPYMAGKSVFEWYVCGLDADYRSRGIFPSVLATWAAIEHGAASDCAIFDFMGVGKPDEPYGVRDFKMRFGGTVVNYGRYIRINNQLKYAVAELGYNFLTWLKKV